MDKGIRMLEIPEEDIRRCNVANFKRLFGNIAQRPDDAKQLRGSLVLGFKAYDSDPRPNWATPAIHDFIQELDETVIRHADIRICTKNS